MSQTPTNPNQQPYSQPLSGQPQGNQQYPQGQYPAQQRYDGPPQGYPQQGYQQPMPQPAPKKKRRGLLIAGIIVGVLLFACVGTGIAVSSHTGTTVATTNPVTTSSSTQVTQVPTKATQQNWTTTHTFTGNGTKKTASFTVGNDWKITWTCKGMDIGGTTADSALSITVTGDNNTPVDVASSTCKAGKTTSDSTEEHTGGTVYLDILGESDWIVNVQELK